MRKFLLLFFCFIFLASISYAEDSKKVSLTEAIEVALENNIDLESNKINIKIFENRIKEAIRLQNPNIDFYHFMGNSANSEPKQIGLSHNIEIAKRKARKNLAKSELKLAEKNYDYTTFDLKMDVRDAYIELVATKSILFTLEQQEQVQEELLSIAQNRVKNKKAPDIDVIQAEIALNQLITQINTARMIVRKALNSFNKVINSNNNVNYDSMYKIFSDENNFEEMLTPPSDKKFPSVESIVNEGLKRRLDLQIYKQQIEIAENNLTVTMRQRIPDVQVMGGYAY